MKGERDEMSDRSKENCLLKPQMIIRLEYYDRKELKKFISDQKKFQKTIPIKGIRKFLTNVGISLGKKVLKAGIIDRKLADTLTNILREKAPVKYKNLIDFMSISHIRYHETGENEMELKVQFEELDLNKVIDTLLKDISGKESGLDHEKNHILFEMLETLNKDIPQESKYELIKTLLQWISDNKVPNSILNTLAQQEGNVGNILQRLDLKIGSITLSEEQ